MANIGQYAAAAMLNWSLGGVAPTRPATWGAALSLGVPTTISMSEIGTASGYTPQTLQMQSSAATSVPGTATMTNTVAMTFGPFSTAQSISGIVVKDTLATAGNILYYGTLTSARTVSIGDSLVIPIGSLVITLN